MKTLPTELQSFPIGNAVRLDDDPTSRRAVAVSFLIREQVVRKLGASGGEEANTVHGGRCANF